MCQHLEKHMGTRRSHQPCLHWSNKCTCSNTYWKLSTSWQMTGGKFSSLRALLSLRDRGNVFQDRKPLRKKTAFFILLYSRSSISIIIMLTVRWLQTMSHFYSLMKCWSRLLPGQDWGQGPLIQLSRLLTENLTSSCLLQVSDPNLQNQANTLN